MTVRNGISTYAYLKKRKPEEVESANVANDARKAVEKETGMPVVSAMNAKQIALGENELIPKGGEE